MEKENKAKFSLPGCVVVAVVSLFISVLTLSIVSMWEVVLLKQQVQNQESTLRELQTIQGDGARRKSTARLELREVQQLKETLQDLISKAQHTQWKGRVARAIRPTCRCRRGKRGQRGARGRRGPPGSQGTTGLPGDEGELGLRGFPGPSGKNGTKGPRGDKGNQGLSGPTGDQGTPGDKGFAGLHGTQGDMGPAGAKGEKGDNGLRGRRGARGRRGPQGPLRSMISESIHLVGDGKRVIQPSTEESIMDWAGDEGRTQGRIHYSRETGSIIIYAPGFYFIYSQLFYCDSNSPVMGHYTFINNLPVLKSVSSFMITQPKIPKIMKIERYTAKYHGGIFRLFRGDQIKVKVAINKTMFLMDPLASLFGAFLVHL